MFLGVDFASVDGNKPIDWAAVKAAGVRFAFIRGTYNEWADPTWQKEHTRARAAGVLVGAYLFPVMSAIVPSVDTQIAAFVSACLVGDLDLPPVLDVEFPGGLAKTGLSRAQALEWVRRAVAALRRTYGVAPMIYTSARVWDGTDADSLTAAPTPDLLDCPLWLARYPYKTRIPAITDRATVDAIQHPPVPKAWGADNVWIHQYQGDALGFKGFSATVDVNRFFALAHGDQGERVRWVQRRLGIAPSGVFDGATERAAGEFQKLKGLSVDGVVGPITFAALCWVHPGVA